MGWGRGGVGLPVARGGALLTPALAAQDYEAYCIDIFFCTEMNAAEWAEQCQGLGCELSAGVDQPAFESLFLEYGRYVPAPSPPSPKPCCAWPTKPAPRLPA